MILIIICFYFAIFFVIVSRIVKVTKRKGNERVNSYTYNDSRGQAAPDKYKTINSHYSQTTLNPTEKSRLKSSSVDMSNHNHAYNHKVEPVDEATVMDLFEDRKESYQKKKEQMKADLPKSSYSEAKNQVMKNTDTKYRNVHRPYGKSGDNGERPLRGEVSISCQYCGAINIIPASRNQGYSCYFCRQEI